ncbi:MAG: alkylmercury lyase family protein [Candidatus Kariarchaeaceae archaeon]|jgi:hypothetical protein
MPLYPKFPIKPTSTEQTTRIFEEACKTENMDAKFGKTLSKEQNDVRRFILTQTPRIGRIPSIEEIRAALPDVADNVTTILQQLNRFDVIHLSPDNEIVSAAYPFSSLKTAHLVTIKDEELIPFYAMCAIDALGIGFMFTSDLSIESLCHHCTETINIEIEDNEISSLKPEKTVVWGDMEYSQCAATSLCKNINFFTSEEHFIEWRSEHPNKKGFLLGIEEALYLGKLFFENRLENSQ